jgi:transcription termination factor NusB
MSHLPLGVPDNPLPTYRTIKTSLKSILNYPEISHEKITNVVKTSHKLVIHTLQFLKLYLLHKYDLDKENLPKVTRSFVVNIIKVIANNSGDTKKSLVGAKEETLVLEADLTLFHNEYYKPTMVAEKFSYKNFGNVLEYLGEDIVTMYETGIKQNFMAYLTKFINHIFKKKKRMDSGLSKAEKSAFCSRLNKVKTALLTFGFIPIPLLLQDHNEELEVLHHHLPNLLPSRVIDAKGVMYDLACNPQDYLTPMIYMMRRLEDAGVVIMNPFPLRSDIIPKYIRFDTASIINVLMDAKIPLHKESLGLKSAVLKAVTTNKENGWRFFFKTEKKCFAPEDPTGKRKVNPYQFNHMISTDGVGCSILLIKREVAGKKKYKESKPVVGQTKESYIDDELPPKDAEWLKGKKIVGIDPNKGDLIYCSSVINETTIDGEIQDVVTNFRYTQNQRKKETKSKKYQKIREDLKTRPENKIDEMTPQGWETKLSEYSKKTLSVGSYKKYLQVKNLTNSKLFGFYEKVLFRKLKWSSYMNIRRSEQRMLSKFEEVFGSKTEVVIGFGDWEQKKTMKFQEPTKGKSMRTLFRKAGYKVYLVDEFRTSCMCYNCESSDGVCETFRKCKNPRPWRKDETITRHGLLRCKTCRGLWNRDLNSSMNIHKIVKGVVDGTGRPEYLQRKNSVILGI